MQPLLEHVNKNKMKYSTFIYLTDGYMSPPGIDPKVPTIIVVTKTGADPVKMKKQGFPGIIIKMN
jgi:predicted metal-dependent peptidase